MRFYAILASALFCNIVPVLKAAPEPCSAADLSGAYGLLQSGNIISVSPFSSVGIATFDGAAHWTLSETISVNGTSAPAWEAATTRSMPTARAPWSSVSAGAHLCAT